MREVETRVPKGARPAARAAAVLRSARLTAQAAVLRSARLTAQAAAVLLSARLMAPAALVLLSTRLTAAADASLCLTGGTVVDPARRAAFPADVVIANGRITRVGPGAARACTGPRFDARGLYVAPGFIDLHVHAWGNPSPTSEDTDEEPGPDGVARLALRAGVLAVLDMGASGADRFAARARLRGAPDAAAFYTGGNILAGGDAGTARERVSALARHAPDVVKIIFSPAAPALIGAAKRLGLPTLVHIATWAEARAAIDAGATAITHLEDEAIVPPDVVAAMATHKTISIPTMAVQCDLARFTDHPDLLDDPLLAAVTTPALRAAYRDPAAFSDKTRWWQRWQRAGCTAHDFPTLRRLHAAGVRLLAGADTGNLGTFQGYSVHREMELFVEAGLPVWTALAAATTDAAAFLRLPWGFAPGTPAELVLLRASPLDDIRNTRRLRGLVHAGRLTTFDDESSGRGAK